MVETRGNEMILLLMLVLQFTGALSRQLHIFSTVREGDETTLSCENVDDHHNCGKTSWIFSHSREKPSVELVNLGQIRNKTVSNRMSVTTNCSLLIKNTTVEDAGFYSCRQFDKLGKPEGPDADVELSVVIMTERNDTDKVTFNCTVRSDGKYRHTVKWLYVNRDVDKNHQILKTSQSSCSATLNFLTYYLKQFQPFHKFFTCSVSSETNKEPVIFNLRPSDKDTKKPTTNTTGSPTDGNKEPPGKDQTTTTTTTTNTTGSAADGNTKPPDLWWVYVIVAVVVAALLITAVTVIRSRRIKGKNTQGNDNVALTSEPAAAQSAPETSLDMADPEDGVSYASVSYTKKANSKAKIRSKNDDDDTVTYSTVKAASTDPGNLYATVNKPNSGP